MAAMMDRFGITRINTLASDWLGDDDCFTRKAKNKIKITVMTW